MSRLEPSGRKLPFLQFGLRQLLALFALMSVLLGIVAPRIWQSFDERQLQDNLRREREIQVNLYAGVRTGDASLVQQALEDGANPNTVLLDEEELRRVVDETPKIVRERFKPIHESRPGLGPTLLGIALSRGYREMATYLIDRGAPLDAIEGVGATLLHRAARGGDPELIRLLVALGLDVNARDDYGDTPLTDSAGRTRPEAIDALIESGAEVNVQGINKETAVHQAVYQGRAEVVRRLLAAGADTSIANVYGDTALDVVQKNMSTLLQAKKASALRFQPGEEDLDLEKKRFREIEQILQNASR